VSPASVSVVLVADTDGPSALTALIGAAAAIEAVEGAGRAVQTVVLASDDPAIAGVLAQAQGATVAPAPPGGRTAAWRAAAGLADGELLWLVATDAVPRAGTLAALLAALAAEPGAALALPAPDAPAPWALVRRDALVAAGIPDDVAPDAPLARVLAAVARGGVVHAAGAGGDAAPRRQPLDQVQAPHGGLQPFLPDSITFGVHSYLGPDAIVKTTRPYERLHVGAYTAIGDDVFVFHPGDRGFFAPDGRRLPGVRTQGAHLPQFASTFPIALVVAGGPEPEPPDDGSVMSRPMVIGNDVWIGARSTVIEASIGDGAVIAAGSVVLRDIPPYSIAAGNPAAPVRQRFSAPTVERLQRIAWWDWPPEQVRAGWRWFYRPIAEFLAHFDPAGELPAGDGAARGS
jgi:acetyltransferase-like isoleucine patch superfamily enzyme